MEQFGQVVCGLGYVIMCHIVGYAGKAGYDGC